MLKFFRKHNKKLLAVFMALLLVVWLGGAALTKLVQPDYSSTVVAATRFGDMLEQDRLRMQHVTAILSQIGFRWQYPLGDTGGDGLNIFDWVLLTREAREMGFAPRPDDAREFLTGQGWTPEQVNTYANRLDIAPEQIYAAVAEYQSVMNTAQIVGQAGQLSEAEVRVAARDVSERVTVNLVALRADSFVDPEATFTDQELEDFFLKYREQEPGRGMAFGYLLPPSAKVQFAKIDIRKVEAGLRVSEKTLLKRAREYWKRNRNTAPAFVAPKVPPAQPPTSRPAGDAGGKTGPDAAAEPTTQPAAGAPPVAPDESAAEQQPPTTPAVDPSSGNAPLMQPSPTSESVTKDEPPAETDEPAAEQTPQQPTAESEMTAKLVPASTPTPTQPPPRPQPVYFSTFAEAREAAMSIVRRQEADKRAARVAEHLIQQLLEPWFDTELGEDNYRKRPQGVEDPNYYQTLIAKLPPEYRYEGAVTTGTTDWFSQDEAAQVPSLGRAWLELPGAPRISFGQLAFQVQGLVELAKNADVDRSVYLARFESCSVPLRDGEGNFYIYRVVGVQSSRAPESLDEVRDRVIADLRVQRGYDEALRRASALREDADKDGLEAAAKRATDLQEIVGTPELVIKPQPFTRKKKGWATGLAKTFIPRLGLVDEEFTKACFELGPADQGKEQRAVIPVPNTTVLTVVEWQKLEHMSKSSYPGTRREVTRNLQFERYSRARREWLDPELVRSRNRFEPTSDRG